MGLNILPIALLICTIILFIVIFYFFKKSATPPKKGSIIVPDSNTDNKVDCITKKTKCNGPDDSSCQNLCQGPNEMKCVKMNNEYVCLPQGPDTTCNKDHGGIDVWTGYGFNDNTEWSCLCSSPQIYGGPNCNTLNPAYCSGGKLDVIKTDDPNCKIENGYQIFNNMCVKCNCPDNYGLAMRSDDNTPICISKNEKDGGGYMGLYGNYVKSPDWRNVYYNINNINTSKEQDLWSKLIGYEFSYGDNIKIKSILDKYNNPINLTQDIVNELIKLSPSFKSNTPFDPDYNKNNKDSMVSYSYFNNVYIP